MPILLGAYDCLLAVLILFPVFLGGFRVDRPGFHLELVQLAIPVLIATAATLAIGPSRARRGRVARFALLAWNTWQSALTRRPARTITLASLAIGALWSLASLRRHWALGSGAADLAIFTGTLWNLTHGLGYVSAMKGWTNLFLDHQSPINYLLAVPFALWPRAETLLLIQGFGLAAGGAAAYVLAVQRFANAGDRASWIPAAVPLLYWAYLPTRNANAFDFHPEVLMLPLFLGGIAAYQGRRYVLGTVFFLLGLFGKESGGVVLCGIGLALLAKRRPPGTTRMLWLGGALVLGGAGLFLFQIRGVPALFFPGGSYVYDAAYASYGGGIAQIVLSPILQPSVFWPHIVGLARLKFLFWTLGALGFLPLLNWRIAIAAFPCYLMVLLTDGDHRVSLYYYYAIEASIGLFWALPGGIARAEAWLEYLSARQISPNAIGLWLLFWALVLFDRGEISRIRLFSADAHAQWVRSELAPCVAGAEVAAPSGLVPHLAARPWARELPELRVPTASAAMGDSGAGWVDCVITDPSVNHWSLSNASYEKLRASLGSLGYQSVYRCEGTEVLAERSPSPRIPRPWEKAGDAKAPSCLSCTPVCPTGI